MPNAIEYLVNTHGRQRRTRQGKELDPINVPLKLADLDDSLELGLRQSQVIPLCSNGLQWT